MPPAPAELPATFKVDDEVWVRHEVKWYRGRILEIRHTRRDGIKYKVRIEMASSPTQVWKSPRMVFTEIPEDW